MKTGLASFLTQLGEEPRLRLAFARAPEAVMAQAGVSGADRAALSSPDASAIYRRVGVDDLPAPKIIGIPHNRA